MEGIFKKFYEEIAGDVKAAKDIDGEGTFDKYAAADNVILTIGKYRMGDPKEPIMDKGVYVDEKKKFVMIHEHKHGTDYHYFKSYHDHDGLILGVDDAETDLVKGLEKDLFPQLNADVELDRGETITFQSLEDIKYIDIDDHKE